jgi:hypothetical protein
MHDAVTLTLTNGPVIAPIFVQGASTGSAYFDMPLSAFNAMVDRVIGVQYTN